MPLTSSPKHLSVYVTGPNSHPAAWGSENTHTSLLWGCLARTGQNVCNRGCAGDILREKKDSAALLSPVCLHRDKHLPCVDVHKQSTKPRQEKQGHLTSNDSESLARRACYLVGFANLDEFVFCSRVLVFVRVPTRQNRRKRGSAVPWGAQRAVSLWSETWTVRACGGILRLRRDFIPSTCFPSPNFIPKHSMGTRALCLMTSPSIQSVTNGPSSGPRERVSFLPTTAMHPSPPALHLHHDLPVKHLLAQPSGMAQAKRCSQCSG